MDQREQYGKKDDNGYWQNTRSTEKREDDENDQKKESKEQRSNSINHPIRR